MEDRTKLQSEAEDVAEGERGQVEKALKIEDEKHYKDVIKPRPDHKTETNLH